MDSVIYQMTLGSASQWLSGLWQSLWLVALSLLFGLMIAIPSGILLASRLPFIYKFPVWLFSYVFRGTPMLVQLYFFYYGVGLLMTKIDGIRDIWLWEYLRQAWVWALIAFALNTGAYTAEIVRGAIETTNKGEIEAGRAFGMSNRQIMWRIILPSAFRRALPSYGNEVIFMLHGSAIAGTVTLLDIMGVGRKLYTDYYAPFTAFLTAGLIYLIITAILVGLFRHLEKRLNRHLV